MGFGGIALNRKRQHSTARYSKGKDASTRYSVVEALWGFREPENWTGGWFTMLVRGGSFRYLDTGYGTQTNFTSNTQLEIAIWTFGEMKMEAETESGVWCLPAVSC